MKALTVAEVMLMTQKATTRDRAMVMMAFSHGLRASEVCGLRLEDIDLNNKQVVIHRLKGSLLTTQALRPNELKVVMAWLKCRGLAPGWVFPGRKGGHLSRMQFWRVVRDLAIKVGVTDPQKRHPHALKHALGVALAERNASAVVIQQTLGHKNIASTHRYMRLTDEQAGRIVAELLPEVAA